MLKALSCDNLKPTGLGVKWPNFETQMLMRFTPIKYMPGRYAWEIYADEVHAYQKCMPY